MMARYQLAFILFLLGYSAVAQQYSLVQTFRGSGTSGGFLAANDEFGFSMDLDGNFLVVGSPSKSSFAGEAYVFELSGGVWVERARLTASDASSSSFFGSGRVYRRRCNRDWRLPIRQSRGGICL